MRDKGGMRKERGRGEMTVERWKSESGKREYCEIVRKQREERKSGVRRDSYREKG